MRRHGASEADIRRMMKSADIRVLEVNWDAVQVYLRCQWDVKLGQRGAIWIGIRTGEIRDTAESMKIEVTPELIDRVKLLAADAGKIRNRRASEASRS